MSLGAGYFDELYEHATDPWSLATRWYERRKYALTLASLPQERYRSGLEVGCSVGVLSRALAGRCDALLAIDVASAAVETARRRMSSDHHVRVEQRQLPGEWPDGVFDLVVLSEVLYYLDAGDAESLLSRAAGALEPGGTLIAVHWRHPVADYPRTGDAVHHALGAQSDRLGLARGVRHTELDFILEVYVRTPPAARSVAEIEGLV